MDTTLQTAVLAARSGAEELLSRAKRTREVREKSSAVDLVSDADIASGVEVVRSILSRSPHAVFLIEEPEVYELTGCTPGQLTDPEVWVIDPLDGTTSFIHHYPCYSVSVACVRDGRAAAGAILNAATGELFTGAEGEGAFLDGSRIACSDAATVPEALIATGFPYDRADTLDRQLRMFARVIRIAQDVRRDGSAAIDCCQTACGRVDAFWELALNPWDLAAGAVILREAGATVTDTQGRDWVPQTSDIVAANPRLHSKLIELVASADSVGEY